MVWFPFLRAGLVVGGAPPLQTAIKIYYSFERRDIKSCEETTFAKGNDKVHIILGPRFHFICFRIIEKLCGLLISSIGLLYYSISFVVFIPFVGDWKHEMVLGTGSIVESQIVPKRPS